MIEPPKHRNTAWAGILTPREAEVLELLASGMTNDQIGKALHLSKGTIKDYVGHIYCALDVPAKRGRNGSYHHSSRVKAARWWWEKVERSREGGET